MTIMHIPAALTMTSREIAELVDSRHDSVKRTIERLVAQGVIESPPLVDFKNINNVAGQDARTGCIKITALVWGHMLA